MPLGEQRRRMRALRAEVIEHDVTWWAQRFLHDLRAMRFDTAERR
jgi:trehalose-6-phosphate synthase